MITMKISQVKIIEFYLFKLDIDIIKQLLLIT